MPLVEGLFGEALRARRRAAGFSIEALAEQADVNVAVISQLENDRRADMLLSTAIKLDRTLAARETPALAQA